MTKPAVHRALLEYGLRYNEVAGQFEGYDYVILEADLKDLGLSEIDQITAGLRDGVARVSLGKGKYFYLR